ncbi:MAG: polyprenyl diphosphate synthase [Gemmatimonadota bacterium]|nr:polyprenyl diphosphate synthase [Gemmatimonadota bacterium]
MTGPADGLLGEVRLNGAVPAHVAVIMDGNGRWAQARDLPRPAGHQAGMNSVREIVEGGVQAGVRVLTLFAFSQENWNRPPGEIAALMMLLEAYVASETSELRDRGVSVRILGDIDRLVPAARDAAARCVAATAGGTALDLNLCISYGSRAEITRAARRLAEQVAAGTLAPEAISEERLARELYTAQWPDPDLLIRTSGEMRLSNFLLWQLAYAEIHVTPVLWPDFNRAHLFQAILDYQRRDRRFGRVSA